MNKDEIINRINSLLDNAVAHGGDAGGPYYSNSKALMQALYNLLKALGLENDVVVGQVLQEACAEKGYISDIRAQKYRECSYNEI